MYVIIENIVKNVLSFDQLPFWAKHGVREHLLWALDKRFHVGTLLQTTFLGKVDAIHLNCFILDKYKLQIVEVHKLHMLNSFIVRGSFFRQGDEGEGIVNRFIFRCEFISPLALGVCSFVYGCCKMLLIFHTLIITLRELNLHHLQLWKCHCVSLRMK